MYVQSFLPFFFYSPLSCSFRQFWTRELIIEYIKQVIIPITKYSHIMAIKGRASSAIFSANNVFYCLVIAFYIISLSLGETLFSIVRIISTWCWLKQKMTKNDCKETFTIAFPIKAAPKKTLNGIRKCPHKKPARSNKGLGIYISLNYSSLPMLILGWQ